ncbi:hypothetical protein [Methylovulum miyakonense]|uniref:hypothetical protein n=1 Tax=Methylovulum miyakonense TaxID=645578 RepID=UPI00038070B6|nr:hypothetical protein [Methylovulum miyakonense]
MALLKPVVPVTTLPETETVPVASVQETTTHTPTVDPVVLETFAPLESSAPAQQLAEVPATNTAVATTSPPAEPVSGGHLTMRDFSEAGFNGLIVDSRTFPIINLKNDGHFKDMDDFDYGTEMRGRLLSSAEKIVMTAKYPDPYKPGTNLEDVVFCIDETRLASGRLVSDWKEEMVKRGGSSQFGTTFEERRYTDVLVVVDQPGVEYDGEMRIWSIAPTSRGRLTGVLNIMAAKAGWKTAQELKEHMSEKVVVASVGAAVPHDKGSFYPWNFKAL